ncbi:MAG: hypothetical protein KC800_03955 [Candidatus Eremiobacteraeota bacterium]|nr:hypothetical protein [Candidatus Eremiobacteraeota bacterium]
MKSINQYHSNSLPRGAVQGRPASKVIRRADFTDALPEGLRSGGTTDKVTLLSEADGAGSPIEIHRRQLRDNPNVFSQISIVTQSRPVGVSLNAEIGHPVNLGDKETTMMAVPFTVEWSRGESSKAGQWTLYADGRLVEGLGESL